MSIFDNELEVTRNYLLKTGFHYIYSSSLGNGLIYDTKNAYSDISGNIAIVKLFYEIKTKKMKILGEFSIYDNNRFAGYNAVIFNTIENPTINDVVCLIERYK